MLNTKGIKMEKMEALDVHIGLWVDNKDTQTILNKEQNLASAKRAEYIYCFESSQ